MKSNVTARVLFLIIILLIALTLSGCGGPSKPSQADLEPQVDYHIPKGSENTVNEERTITDIEWDKSSETASTTVLLKGELPCYSYEMEYFCRFRWDAEEKSWQMNHYDLGMDKVDFSKLEGSWSCDYENESVVFTFSDAGIYFFDHESYDYNDATVMVEHNLGSNYRDGELTMEAEGGGNFLIDVENFPGKISGVYVTDTGLYYCARGSFGDRPLMTRIS